MGLFSMCTAYALFLTNLDFQVPFSDGWGQGRVESGNRSWEKVYSAFTGHGLVVLSFGVFFRKGWNGCLHAGTASELTVAVVNVSQILGELPPKPFAESNENVCCWQLVNLMLKFSVVSQGFPTIHSGCWRPVLWYCAALQILFSFFSQSLTLCFYLGVFYWRYVQLGCAISKFCRADLWEAILWSISMPKT